MHNLSKVLAAERKYFNLRSLFDGFKTMLIDPAITSDNLFGKIGRVYGCDENYRVLTPIFAPHFKRE